jgi:hypothetical protein
MSNKIELVQNLIVDAMMDGYKKMAEVQGLNEQELMDQNRAGVEGFATTLANKINMIYSNIDN